ncbi:DUF6199 family natural product biosynthesis protein [Paenibacillus popilliae]|uniref:DUF6199 domain-containing protein n=1 Tax=Paenibacillus popilliae TaxID=78057 RepID=A0ABY3AP36_PAEPP|nr:DUF6199 family natural product biosynthesis protein [Paenibacillus sp. SDF0028]TQR44390.1 hypothetical protein C7Y44_14715 [Paenibacillus sp. SDF0028]
MTVFLAVVIIIAGAVSFFFPKFGWEMKHGWTVDGGIGPSDDYIMLTKISGFIIMAVGLVLFIYRMIV